MEHAFSKSFEKTNWNEVLKLYQHLYTIHQAPLTLLNQAIINLQLNKTSEALNILNRISPEELGQRSYLYYGTKAEYYNKIKNPEMAIDFLNKALDNVTNISEKEYLEKKKASLDNK